MFTLKDFVVFAVFAIFTNKSDQADISTDGYWGGVLDFATEWNCSLSSNYTYDLGDSITIHWYDTNSGDHNQYILADAATEILANENFDPSTPWYVFIHGFLLSVDSESTVLIKDALMTKADHYVFIVDHSNHSYSTLNIITSFQRYSAMVKPIADSLKDYFFDDMIAGGVSPENIHVIGPSMGAQIVGHLGHTLTSEGNVLKKCTGLDPTGPCFTDADNDSKLSSGDCAFVEVIHTNAGQCGTSSTVSDFEAYANCAGKMQPYCFYSFGACYVPTKTLQAGVFTTGLHSLCSHMYSITVYARSVNVTAFKATACEDYSTYVSGDCSENEAVSVGFNSDSATSYSGLYYFETDSCSCELN